MKNKIHWIPVFGIIYVMLYLKTYGGLTREEPFDFIGSALFQALSFAFIIIQISNYYG